MIKLINRFFFKYFNLKLMRIGFQEPSVDMDSEFVRLYAKYKNYTMTSVERMYAAYSAINYIEQNGIDGSVVECGVWKGGTMMLMADRLKQLNSVNRKLYLYDTYEGMTEPSDKDVDYSGKETKSRWESSNKTTHVDWCYASLEEVKNNLTTSNYPQEKLEYVKGKVEETIPKVTPEKIAILRLDTDWYESTKHELIHLFPLLSPGGILILDDYGFWKGQREAVDEYFKNHNIHVFLNRIDYTGRLVIKNK